MMLFGIMLPSFTLNIERWRWNEDFQLWVSNQGHFRDKCQKAVSIKIGSNGYCRVKGQLAHRVVAITWIPCDNPEGMTIDYLNHNKRDNSVKNLEWVTKEENQRRAIADFEQVVDVRQARKPRVKVVKKSVLPFTIKYSPKDGSDKIIFDSWEEAVAFVINKYGVSDDYATIVKRIKRKMSSDGKCYGGNWKKEVCV